MKKLLYTLFILALSTSADAITRQQLIAYAKSLKGKSKTELKEAIYELCSPNTVLEYGSGEGCTWEGFYSTDRTDDGQCIDRYSNDTWYFSRCGNSISGMNIEHSFPKSWWGGTENNAYKDLYNLMPCEAKINSSKSNYGMGVVVKASADNNCTKVGTGSSSFKLWEPADKWKGDFARGYMYMATVYQNLCSNYTGEGLNSLEKDTWPTLQKWAYTLYLSWAEADGVSQMEVDRNNAVWVIQGNRNLFVDFPTLAEYVWGDSIDAAFNPETALTTCSDDARYGLFTDNGEELSLEEVIYSESFSNTQGEFSIENQSADDALPYVWTTTASYGMKATAYYDGKNYDADSWLISPVIDLAGYASATLTFSQCISKYFTDISSEATLWIKDQSGDWQQIYLSYPSLSSGSSYSSFESQTISLNMYAGQKIQIAFRYISTESAGTWEIKNFKVSGIQTTDIRTSTAPRSSHLIYNIAGQRVDGGYSGIVVSDGRKYLKRKK